MRNILKISLLIVLLTSAIITQTGCSDKAVSKTDFCLNTTCEITIYGMSQREGEDLLQEAFSQIRSYEALLSKTVEGSDVYNINNAAGQPVTVSDHTVEVISEGIRMGELSGGMFDITIGEVTDLWDFTGENPSVPEQEALEKSLESVDYTHVILEGNRARLTDPEAQLDLGGIAKGYIADRTSEFLLEQGAGGAVINLGGNIVTIGEKEAGKLWNIGIERPYSDRTELAGSVQITDGTLVTSGVYERKFYQDDVLYHHVLDPYTGFPVETDLESVTILAKEGNSCFCDGLSTVCLMLGKEKALTLIEQLRQKYPDCGIEAALIDKNDDMVQTEGMNIRVPEE